MDSGSSFVYADRECCRMCMVPMYRDAMQLSCGCAICRHCAPHCVSEGMCRYCGAFATVQGEYVPERKQNVADTNVFEVKLSKLCESCPMATGDPIFCKNCNAMLNAFSTVTTEESNQVWKCEFCTYQNVLVLDPAEMPKSDQVTYILDAAPAEAEAKSLSEDTTTCIFCMDTSGSMGTAVTIATPISIKGGKPTNRPTRLECVKAAIEAQVNQMLERSPDRHMGIVEFESRVTVHGDGMRSEDVAANFNDFDALLACMAGKHDLLIGRTLLQAKNEILTKVFELHPKGMTALGPALTVSVALAMQGKAGSKIIICTDGIANQGIGSIESASVQDTQAQKFYDEIGLLAQRNGVSISIISVTDAECKLAYLSSVANMTEGTILRVDPTTMADEFSNILQERIIATEVRVRVTMHKGLKFKNENPEELQLLGSQLVRTIGNVSQVSSFTFEYAIKNEEEMKTSEVDLAGMTQLPFQLIIEYRNLAGQRCVKCFAKVLKLSTNREEAERGAHNSILQRNYVGQQGRRADIGYYQEMEREEAEYRRVIERTAQTEEEQRAAVFNMGRVMDVRLECQHQMTREEAMGMRVDEQAMDREEVRQRRLVMKSDKNTIMSTQLRRK